MELIRIEKTLGTSGNEKEDRNSTQRTTNRLVPRFFCFFFLNCSPLLKQLKHCFHVDWPIMIRNKRIHQHG
jgi:hypothetical protein